MKALLTLFAAMTFLLAPIVMILCWGITLRLRRSLPICRRARRPIGLPSSAGFYGA